MRIITNSGAVVEKLLHRCVDCGVERWVRAYYIKQGQSLRCHTCANRIVSDSKRAKLSINRKVFLSNPANRLAISKALSGRPKTLEHRQHLSEARKEFLLQHPDFNNAHFTGRHHTAETRYKCALSTKGRKQSPEEIERRVKSFKLYYQEHPEEKRIGERSPTWRGGVSFLPYPTTFTKQIKGYIKERDGYTCQLCHLHEDGIKHCVHHIDYVKDNVNHSNLIELCRSCNAKVNGDRLKWMVYFQRLVLERGLCAL